MRVIAGGTLRKLKVQVLTLAVTSAFLLPAMWASAEHAGDVKPENDATLMTYGPTERLSGRIAIAGSDTMRPLLARLAAEFKRLHPEVKLAIEGGGSSAGIREFIIGYSQQRRGEKSRQGHDGGAQVEVLASSRELTADERRGFSARYGYEPLQIAVAMDGVAVYVHRDNPIQGLTLEQLDAIFSQTRKRGYREQIKTWRQVGLNDGWERQPIRLYGRDRESGTHDFFELVALKGGKLSDEVVMLPGSASEVLAIAQDPLGIGFAGIGFEASYVRAVPLAEHAGGPFVEPTPDSVRDGSYPFSRYLYLYVNQDPEDQFDPTLREFLRFVNSREGQQTVAKARFYPLPPNLVAKNLALINGNLVTASLPVSIN